MDKPDNLEREHRILDAASDLFVHYGYDKTTVSDIARSAGVSKGAIYLHFTSKEELFEGLLLRELLDYNQRWLALTADDPLGGTIGGIYKNTLYALNSSPFMVAIFKKDRRVLGNYIRKPGNLFQKRGTQTARLDFVKLMQSVGAIRDDVDPTVTAHIMDMLAFGLVAMDDVKHSDDIPETDAIIEGIAMMMDRAFTPANGANSEAGKAILMRLSAERKASADIGGGNDD